MKQLYIERINDCFYMSCQLVSVYGVNWIKARRAFDDAVRQITDDGIKDDTLTGIDFSDIIDFTNECYNKLDKLSEVK